MKKIVTFLLVVYAVLCAIGAPKRAKCKSPMGCKDFAEVGQNFCDKHRCDSYGCKEHCATLTEPGWVLKSYYSSYYSSSFSSSSSKKAPKKISPPYCKKHMCQRVMPQWPGGTYDLAYRSIYDRYYLSSYSSTYDVKERNEKLVKYYFCANERLAGGKYCREHACKVSTCAAMRWESFVQVEGSAKHVQLDAGETCKAHSAKDPDSIPERTGKAAMTCGERVREQEEAAAAKAAENK